jgi:hypothetical protein
MRAFFLLGLISSAACAIEVPPGKTVACDFGAFVTETDPAGLNVRNGPGDATKVVGRLPPMYANPGLNGYRVKVEVEVLGSRNGWLRITNAQDNEALTEMAARPMHHGPGWVSGRKLGVKSQASRGYAQPNERSKVVLRQVEGWPFDSDDMVEAGRLVACKGKWALVEFDVGNISATWVETFQIDPMARAGLPKGRFRAWLNRICGIQETTCDGMGDSEPEPRR